jgi:hypothetical protein
MPDTSDHLAAFMIEVQQAIDLCMRQPEEPVISIAIDQLRSIQSALQQGQSPQELVAQRKVFIGAYAAKNLDDWNPELARVLMNLDFRLKNLHT